MSTTMTQVPAVVPTATASNNMSSNPGLFNPASLNPTNSQPFTILRIKRKRTEEPLEALVVESTRRKKSRGGVGVFQYAQTVEDDAWNDAARQKHIQEEITRLAEQNARDAAEAVKQAAAHVAPVAPAQAAPPSPITSRKPREERRYTIVEKPEEPKQPQRRYPVAPPKVYSSKELEAAKKAAAATDIKMYDAVPAASVGAAAGSPMKEDDEDMDNFLPMLQDYLRVHDGDDVSAPPKKSSALHTYGTHHAQTTDTKESEYVWDVFYHRPATMSEWNAVAANVGTISGLPPSLEGYDSASDSEEELDEADEDSNAEEYYKNDYPEDEDNSGSSDEFHEDSEYDDDSGYEDNAERFNFPR